MLPMINKDYAQRGMIALSWLVMSLMIVWIPSVYAATGDATPGFPLTSATTTSVSAQSMLVNIATQIPSLMRLVTAFAYVIGFYFMIHGIMLLKHAGEMRTQMSHEHSLSKPIGFLVVGAMLTYLPATVQVGLSTFWTDPNPYGYMQMQDQWYQFLNVCFLIVQFIGVIAFIRGLILLKDIGGHAGGQSSFGKGITHIIGGILCINIYQFVQVVMITLGLQPY